MPSSSGQGPTGWRRRCGCPRRGCGSRWWTPGTSRAGGQKNPCAAGASDLSEPCPISHVPEAACRLVGIRTRGRTAARDTGSLSGDGYPRGKDPGDEPRPEQRPAAGGETGEPRSPRGTQLKATTNGLFWSRRPSKGRHRRGLFLFARRAVGVIPSNPRQLPGALRPPGSTRLQSAWVRATHRPLTPATRGVVTSTARPRDGRSRTRAGRRP